MLRRYLNEKKTLIVVVVVLNQLIAMYRVQHGYASPWFKEAIWNALGGVIYLALSFTWFAFRHRRQTAKS